MKSDFKTGRSIVFLLCAWSVAPIHWGAFAVAAQEKLKEYRDREYGYSFEYPEAWQIQSLPEGEADKSMRVMLQGPVGSSFMVVVEKATKKITKEEFNANPERDKIVVTLISQVIEQIYQRISENLKATEMAVGERRDLSNAVGIKFYVATLHRLPMSKPIIVAGIHAFPFGKDYSVNFLMTAFWDGEKTQEQQTLTAVFNTFRLLGEQRLGGTSSKPALPGKELEDR
jgi:hypothetical protein